MDNLVSINHTKENILEFNLSIEGINPSDMKAKFIVCAEGMELGFVCGRENGDKWTVTLPPLPFLERTAYPFHVEISADGYFFEPLRGTCNVVGGNDVYISTPKNPKIASPTGPKEEEKKETKKESIQVPKTADLPKTKGREKPVAQIAQELMEANKKPVPAPQPTPVPTEVPTEPVKMELKPFLPKIVVETKEDKKGEKDEQVRAILVEAGLASAKKPSKKYPRYKKD